MSNNNAILKARPRLIDEDISRAFLERPEILAAAKTAAGRRDAAAALIAAQAQRLAADYAHEVVQRWAKLEGHYAAAVQGNNPGEIAKVTVGMEKLETWLRSHSNVEALLRRRGVEFGIEVGSLLHRDVRGEPWKEMLAPEPTPEPDQPEEAAAFVHVRGKDEKHPGRREKPLRRRITPVPRRFRSPFR